MPCGRGKTAFTHDRPVQTDTLVDQFPQRDSLNIVHGYRLPDTSAHGVNGQGKVIRVLGLSSLRLDYPDVAKTDRSTVVLQVDRAGSGGVVLAAGCRAFA